MIVVIEKNSSLLIEEYPLFDFEEKRQEALKGIISTNSISVSNLIKNFLVQVEDENYTLSLVLPILYDWIRENSEKYSILIILGSENLSKILNTPFFKNFEDFLAQLEQK